MFLEEVGTPQLGHSGNVFDGGRSDLGLVVLEEAGEEFEYLVLTCGVFRTDETEGTGDGGEYFGKVVSDSPKKRIGKNRGIYEKGKNESKI